MCNINLATIDYFSGSLVVFVRECTSFLADNLITKNCGELSTALIIAIHRIYNLNILNVWWVSIITFSLDFTLYFSCY